MKGRCRSLYSKGGGECDGGKLDSLRGTRYRLRTMWDRLPSSELARELCEVPGERRRDSPRQ